MATNPWVRLPSAWIADRRLAGLLWKHGGEGSDSTAALMVLTVIAHAADQESGVARATYDDIGNVTGLSRSKISNGLDILKDLKVVEPGPEGARSTYFLANFDSQRGWAKLPAKSMYAGGRIASFADFQLRRSAELDALKLFFLFVARRSNDTNMAKIGFEKIEAYTGVQRGRIKTAVSLLASLSLIYVEHVPSEAHAQGIANAYRIVGLDPYIHMGTRGRGMDGVLVHQESTSLL